MAIKRRNKYWRKGFSVQWVVIVLLISCSNNEDTIIIDEDYSTVDTTIAYSSEAYLRNSEASILQLADGRLFCAYTQFQGGVCDSSTANIVGSYSFDGGLTWCAPHVIVQNTNANNVMSVSLVRYKNEIHMYFLSKNSDEETKLDMDISRVITFDETCNWGSVEILNKTVGYWGVLNDAVIVTRDNRILIPVSHYETYQHWTDKAYCFILYSNNGQDWHKTNELLLEDNCMGGLEPTLCELSSGGILMSMRTKVGFQYFSYSNDGGKSLNEPFRLNLLSADSPCKIFSYNQSIFAIHNPKDRHRLVISRSNDDGQTWDEVHELEENLSATISYPSAFIANNRLYISHWFHSDVEWSLKFKAFHLTTLR